MWLSKLDSALCIQKWVTFIFWHILISWISTKFGKFWENRSPNKNKQILRNYAKIGFLSKEYPNKIQHKLSKSWCTRKYPNKVDVELNIGKSFKLYFIQFTRFVSRFGSIQIFTFLQDPEDSGPDWIICSTGPYTSRSRPCSSPDADYCNQSIIQFFWRIFAFSFADFWSGTNLF